MRSQGLSYPWLGASRQLKEGELLLFSSPLILIWAKYSGVVVVVNTWSWCLGSPNGLLTIWPLPMQMKGAVLERKEILPPISVTYNRSLWGHHQTFSSQIFYMLYDAGFFLKKIAWAHHHNQKHWIRNYEETPLFRILHRQKAVAAAGFSFIYHPSGQHSSFRQRARWKVWEIGQLQNNGRLVDHFSPNALEDSPWTYGWLHI